MNRIVKRILYFFVVLFSLLFLAFILIIVFQEKFFFHPKKLETNYSYQFKNKFEEININTDDAITLNALHFKTDSAKGVILYYHGNAGALDKWGNVADTYLANKYNFFVFDYRGFGKSTGKINSEETLYNDAQKVYDYVKNIYPENKIVVTGYSIGTGIAAKIASKNRPKQLILIAPYYNFVDVVQKHVSIIPSFAIKYKLTTNEFIPIITAPITIFHGRNDEVINFESSEKLNKLLQKKDQFIPLSNQGHVRCEHHQVFRNELSKILQ